MAKCTVPPTEDLHALGPKSEAPTPTPNATTSVADTLALATILATTVATATATTGRAASTPPEFQQLAETPPAVVHVKPTVEPRAVYVTVVGAKAMHKTLKGK